MTRGLVVGKFMPLHRGHQLLIESALAQVDDLTIVIYDSHPPGDYPAMPVEMRAAWLAKLYPQIENIVPREDLFVGLPQHEKDSARFAQPYADDLAFLGSFDLVFSSEDYGDEFAAALGAESIVVDPARGLLPISGTEIRENVFAHRGWLDPIVCRDLVQKVVFVGTESAGKSTLAQRMAEEMQTKWVHEYGRELWIYQDLQGSFHDLLKIATKQYEREEAALLHADRFLFCDTNPWTTLQWSLMYHNTADVRLVELAKRTNAEYRWFFCSADFGWVDDGVRELRGSKAAEFELQLQQELLGTAPHTVLSGPISERVDLVKSILLK